MNEKNKSRYEGAEWLTSQEAQRIYHFSRGLIDNSARQCGARLKVGKSVRYSKKVLDEYFASLAKSRI